MISKCRYFLWLLWKKVVHRPVLSILITLVVIYFAAAVVVMAYENIDFGSAAIKVFPAFFGELGEVQSPYIAVNISILIGIIVSVTFIAIVTAKITSSLIELVRRGGTMATKINFTGHTIICGWNFQGTRITKELLSANIKEQRGIVVLADLEERPKLDDRIEFVRGDPSRSENLIRAGIKKADSVIVLTDFTKGASTADAQALMIVLAVESLHPKVHTCVQIIDSANRVHLENAHADEIICLDQMGGSLAVTSALNHGIASVVTELLSFDKGSEFYRYDKQISDTLIGKEFAEAVRLLAQKRILLLGFETDYSEELKQQLKDDVINRLPEADRVVIVNPNGEYKLRQGDALFIIAESEPVNI